MELGQSVRRGQLLAEIDPTLAQNELQQELALLEQQEAGLTVKEVEVSAAERELKKQKLMMAADATTGDDVERAKDQLRKSHAELKGLRAQVKQTKAVIDSSNARLAYTRIVAPMDGRVINISVQPGQTVNAVQQVPTVLTLAQLERMTIRAKVPEADVASLKIGQPVMYNTLGKPDLKVASTLETLQPSPDRVNGALFYNALFEVANANHELWPEMTVNVAFVMAERKNVLILPWAALGDRVAKDRYAVTLLDDRKTVHIKEVGIGIDDGINVEITQGVQVGEKVMTFATRKGH